MKILILLTFAISINLIDGVFERCELKLYFLSADKNYRFSDRRSSILEAACKRKPFLGFCKDASFGRRSGPISPSRPPYPRPSSSRPSSSRPSSSRPSSSRPSGSKPFPFGASERFGSSGGRFSGGDFERSDRLEGGNSNRQKITGTNRRTSVSESLGLGGGTGVGGGGGGGGVGVGSGLGIGVPGVGPIGVNSGVGVSAPGIGGGGGGGLGGLGLGNGGLFGIGSGVGVSTPIGPIGVNSGFGIGK